MSDAPRVQRFRSIEDMNSAPIRTPAGEPFERFLRLCARYWKIAPRAYPRGVFKYRSIDEAQRARARREGAGTATDGS